MVRKEASCGRGFAQKKSNKKQHKNPVQISHNKNNKTKHTHSHARRVSHKISQQRDRPKIHASTDEDQKTPHANKKTKNKTTQIETKTRKKKNAKTNAATSSLHVSSWMKWIATARDKLETVPSNVSIP